MKKEHVKVDLSVLVDILIQDLMAMWILTKIIPITWVIYQV